MGLPFSGNGTPIDFSDIQTTFGGANPISMSEYYRGGAYVTDNNTSVPTNEFTITSVSWSASVAIIGISGSTVIPVGTSVVIAGMIPSGYNGTYIVTVSSAGSFRYALATDPNIANVFTITAASWLASVVTIVISGSTVIPVSSSVIIAGMTPAGYNGTYTVTVSSAGTFRYALATNPGVATVFGTATRSTVFGTATTATGTFPIAVGNFYGASKQFSLAIAANTTNLTVNSAYLTTAGWDGASYFQITVNSGIYVYSTSTASSGMNITGSFPYGFGVVNGGYILGMGGAGGNQTSPYTGFAGGPALTVTNSFTTATMSILNNSGAYIAGGGGGGAGMPNSGGEITGGGGGGAGGGAGGQARQNRGGYNLGTPGTGGAIGVAGTNATEGTANLWPGFGGGAGGGGGSYDLGGISATRDGGGSGGGGGRILPGSGGAGGTQGDNGGNGGSAGAAGGNGTFSGSDHVGAGGGGGWGAAGGSATHSTNSASGGAGGAAIDKNNSTVTVTNNGTVYGSILA